MRKTYKDWSIKNGGESGFKHEKWWIMVIASYGFDEL